MNYTSPYFIALVSSVIINTIVYGCFSVHCIKTQKMDVIEHYFEPYFKSKNPLKIIEAIICTFVSAPAITIYGMAYGLAKVIVKVDKMFTYGRTKKEKIRIENEKIENAVNSTEKAMENKKNN